MSTISPQARLRGRAPGPLLPRARRPPERRDGPEAEVDRGGMENGRAGVQPYSVEQRVFHPARRKRRPHGPQARC